jgi:hypothetical protein
MRLLVGVVFVCISISACGNKAPAAPNVPDTTVTGMTMAPAVDLILINQVQPFSVTATFSDGTSRAVTGAWGSDAPTIAAAAPTTGQVTGRGAGMATVFADFEGRRATRLLRVVPNYAGPWEGAFREVECEATLDWRGGCDELDTTTRWRMEFDFTQNQANVSGQVRPFVDLSVPTQGSVSVPGILTQTGSQAQTADGLTLEFRILDWNTETRNNIEMTGSFRGALSVSGFQGSMTSRFQLDGMTKGNSTLPTGAGGPRGGVARQWTPRLPVRR